MHMLQGRCDFRTALFRRFRPHILSQFIPLRLSLRRTYPFQHSTARFFRAPRPARFPDAELKRLAAEIRKSPGRGWSVSERAEALGISERALNARFLKLYSRSFHKFVLDRRMESALRHLKSGRLSCARIAEKVGYANAHSLDRKSVV